MKCTGGVASRVIIPWERKTQDYSVYIDLRGWRSQTSCVVVIRVFPYYFLYFLHGEDSFEEFISTRKIILKRFRYFKGFIIYNSKV